MTHSHRLFAPISQKQEITSAVNHLVLYPNHKSFFAKEEKEDITAIIKCDIFHK